MRKIVLILIILSTGVFAALTKKEIKAMELEIIKLEVLESLKLEEPPTKDSKSYEAYITLLNSKLQKNGQDVVKDERHVLDANQATEVFEQNYSGFTSSKGEEKLKQAKLLLSLYKANKKALSASKSKAREAYDFIKDYTPPVVVKKLDPSVPQVFFDRRNQRFGLKSPTAIILKGKYEAILPFKYDWTYAKKRGEEGGGIDIIDKQGRVVKVLDRNPLEKSKESSVKGAASAGKTPPNKKTNPVVKKIDPDKNKLVLTKLEYAFQKKNVALSQFIFKTQSRKHSIFVDLKNKKALRLNFRSAVPLNDYLIVAESSLHVKALVRVDGKVIDDGYSSIRIMRGTPDLILCTKMREAKLYHVDGRPFFKKEFTYSDLKFTDESNTFCYEVKEKWGLMNRKQQVIKKPTFSKIQMSKDLITFEIDVKGSDLKGLMNNNGEILVKPQTDIYFYLYKNYCFVRKSGKGYVYTSRGLLFKADAPVSITDANPKYKYFSSGNSILNIKGEVVMTLDVEARPRQSDAGLLMNGKLYSPKGKLLLDHSVHTIRKCPEGYSVFESNKGWGFISRNYSFVLQPKYEAIGSVKNGRKYHRNLLTVKKNGLWGVYDIRKGKQILPFKFTGIVAFGNKLVLTLKDKTCITDMNGKIIVKPATFALEKSRGHLAVIRYKEKFGIISNTGKLIVKPYFIEQENALQALSFLRWQKNVSLFNGLPPNDVELLQAIQKQYSPALQLTYKIEAGKKGEEKIHYALIDGKEKKLGKGKCRFLTKDYYQVGAKLYNVNGTESYELGKIIEIAEDIYSCNGKRGLSGSYKVDYYIGSYGNYDCHLLMPSGLIKGHKGFTVLDNGDKSVIQYWEDYKRSGLMNMKGKIILPARYYEIRIMDEYLICDKGMHAMSIEDFVTFEGKRFRRSSERVVFGTRAATPYVPIKELSEKIVEPSFMK